MKKIGQVNFKVNGAKMVCYLHKKHKGSEPSDIFEIKLIPQKGNGEPSGWFMNVYDMQNIIWLLAEASLVALEEDKPLKPKEVKCQFCSKPATKFNFKPDKEYEIGYDLCNKCAKDHKESYNSLK
jgi:hypothetical protein